MNKKAHKEIFIPAATLAFLGLENSHGALACENNLEKIKNCDPSNISFTEIKKAEDINKNTQQTNLYKRDNIIEKNKKDNQKISKNSQNKKSKLLSKKASDIILPKLNTKAKINQNNKNTQTYTYIVSKGDTLAMIAKEFNTSIKLIKELNNIKNEHIEAGEKLKIPQNTIYKKNIKSFYIVKANDTLSSISKEFNIPVKKLLKYNNLKSEHIKVGDKIYLKYINIANNKRVEKAKKILEQFVKKTSKMKVLKVTATAYTSHKGQTDSTPFLAAWNNRLRPGMKVIAVSRDLIKKYGLTNGKRVKIKGLPGYYIVKDKMNKRFKKRIDIYMGVNKRKALKWGKKEITIMF